MVGGSLSGIVERIVDLLRERKKKGEGNRVRYSQRKPAQHIVSGCKL
jgi:hypothetical protein